MDKEELKILYIDDELMNLKAFELSFKKKYTILTASCAEEAFDILNKHGEIPVIVTDQKMPGMTGIEFLEKTIEKYPDSVRILLTAYTDPEDFLNAINMGKVYSYIVKPWTNLEVDKVISGAFERYFLKKENVRLISELKNKINELEQTQEKLIEQEKKAVVGTIAAGLYHEIKNLLGPIEILKLIEDDQYQEFIHYILDSRDRIINLIDEIRALAKDKEIEYTYNNHNIKDIIEETVNLIMLDPQHRNLKIIKEYNHNKECKIDKNKIIQVFINLIKNANHAIEDKKDGFIKIVTSHIDDIKIKIEIIDNGTGIDSEKLDNIWEPFFTTKGATGTGLGLFISKKIINKHNGEIVVTSESNRGTNFSIILPAMQ